MGHVAIAAGYYLMAKLGIHLFAEFSARELFDVDHVSVKKGLIICPWLDSLAKISACTRATSIVTSSTGS
jgi:hypothetical protein